MTKFRSRLLFALITLIMVVLVAVGVLLGQVFKGYYVSTFNSRLEIESEWLASEIEEAGGIDQLRNVPLRERSKLLDARISILDDEGKILFDQNDSSLESNEKVLQEIYLGWKRSEDGYEISQTDINMRNYWVAIKASNGTTEGILVLSTSIEVLKTAYGQIWLVLAVSLGLSLIVIILLASKITAQYTKPIESATTVAIELAKGNYRARTFEDYIDETSMLSSSINILARNLQEMVSTQEMQQDRLMTLIENMGSGLLLIDPKGYIVLINKAYKEQFHIKPFDLLRKRYYEAISNNEINKIVEEVFMTEQKVRKQLLIPVNIEIRHFEVYGAPIIGNSDEWKGILLVFHDITELKKLEQMRKDFVANVSHELKTPITSIKGFSETLLDGAMNDRDTLQSFLHIILKESDRLQSLIQDLLDLSKIEKQGFHLSVYEVNVNDLAEDVLMMLQSKADEKQVTLQFKPGSQAIIEGDAPRLKQILINLISNGISYTPEKGRVSIGIVSENEEVNITVQDTGVGMERSEIPRIFERFYRVDKARSRNSGGTGLGLAIVKHLVEAHHGTIEVSSEEGMGTMFTLTFQKKIRHFFE
ncbi:two-component system histidine kinase PnpS [Bacillus sp. 2205SS5-2]|uniref:two-component system histidine kinase PnpS n=1 Tax=Bacillus sp. 2205SS5-2 TaxID=3109031 RepID=UPI003005A297